MPRPAPSIELQAQWINAIAHGNSAERLDALQEIYSMNAPIKPEWLPVFSRFLEDKQPWIRIFSILCIWLVARSDSSHSPIARFLLGTAAVERSFYIRELLRSMFHVYVVADQDMLDQIWDIESTPLRDWVSRTWNREQRDLALLTDQILDIKTKVPGLPGFTLPLEPERDTGIDPINLLVSFAANYQQGTGKTEF